MYYLLYGFFYLLSLLPFRVIHFLSDCIYALIYYVFGYRKEVVMKNLTIAFPEKTEKEKVRVAKDFYHNLLDTFLEIPKLLTMSPKALAKRMTANFEGLDRLKPSGQSVQVHTGHFFNWEFANAGFGQRSLFEFLVVYMPVKNEAIDKLFKKIRLRFGTKLIAATAFRKEFLPFRDKQYCLVLVGDQNPGIPSRAWWVDFFGKPAPFVRGPEAGARANNTAVVFCNFYPVKRGFYHTEVNLFTTTPRELPEGEITEKFIRFIEESIRKRPANYLWSHRRWKHEWKPEYGPVIKDATSPSAPAH